MHFLMTPLIHKYEDLSFTRIGTVTDKSVRVFIRTPSPQSAENEEVRDNQVRIIYRPTKPLGQWIMGPQVTLERERDWTGIGEIKGLLPSTEYECRSISSSSSILLSLIRFAIDRITLPLSPSVHHPFFPSSQIFKTFPDPELAGLQTHFRFVSSSCMQPGWPVEPGRGIWRDVNELKGMKLLGETLKKETIDFGIFVG
jgi:alkaline phosphatase D